MAWGNLWLKRPTTRLSTPLILGYKGLDSIPEPGHCLIELKLLQIRTFSAAISSQISGRNSAAENKYSLRLFFLSQDKLCPLVSNQNLTSKTKKVSNFFFSSSRLLCSSTNVSTNYKYNNGGLLLLFFVSKLGRSRLVIVKQIFFSLSGSFGLFMKDGKK